MLSGKNRENLEKIINRNLILRWIFWTFFCVYIVIVSVLIIAASNKLIIGEIYEEIRDILAFFPPNSISIRKMLFCPTISLIFARN